MLRTKFSNPTGPTWEKWPKPFRSREGLCPVVGRKYIAEMIVMMMVCK